MVRLTEVEALCNAREVREKKCSICTHGKEVFDGVFLCDNKRNKSRKFWYRNYFQNCGFKEKEDES